jgi:acetyl esterase/lipase
MHSRFMTTRLAFLSAGIFALLASPGHAQQPGEQFKRFDRNGDGKITREEAPGPLFARIDRDGNGEVTPDEARAFAAQRPGALQAPRVSDAVEAHPDLPYAGTENRRQTLDLYLPKQRASDQPLPVVVFIHGGGWQNGDKRGGYRMLAPLVESGEYAGVSVGYRLTDEAIWPAQIHDCKAAIRWIRGNAKKYNLDPERIGATGPSAGGHLVAMLGTSGDVAELEGKLGEHLDQSSRVLCVVDQFGPTDFVTMGGMHNNRNSPEAKLLGGLVQENKEAARSASPTTYVSPDDPPFLFIHGTEDRVVRFAQSERLHEALTKAGVPSTLIPVEGGGHGQFGTAEVGDRLKQFFDKHLRGQDVAISKDPLRQGRQ